MTDKNTASAQEQTIAKIAALNDAARATIHRPTGHNRVVMTAGIAEMVGDVAQWPAYRRQRFLLRTIMEYDAFSEDNNPHGERDFGDFEWNGVRCYWKIDCYDLDLKFGSPDPANDAVTARVLTILRADEY